MAFLHFFIIPSIIIIFILVFQNWLNKDESIDFIKIFLSGIIAGIIISVIKYFIDKIFKNSAHILSISLKSSLLDGLLITIIICILFYLIINFILKYSNFSWYFSTVISFGFLAGIFTVINITQTITNSYFSYPVEYLNLISFLIFNSLLLGIGAQKYFDSYETFKKILWAAFTIFTVSLSFGLYNFLNFYNNIFKFTFILFFVVFAAFFEIFEFRYNRH